MKALLLIATLTMIVLTTDHAVGQTCTTKFFYHDFGFLNGPNPVDVPDGVGTKTLLISGSKNGTLYALNEADGTIAWANSVLPKPVSPAFAGFGLFNGPLAIADGIVYAALYEFIPAVVPAPDHLQAFDATDGSVVWTDDIGKAWSGVGAANGVVYAGNNVTAEFFAYDAAGGTRLAAFPLPAITSSVATVDGGVLYIGYGIFGNTGGVRAYAHDPPQSEINPGNVAALELKWDFRLTAGVTSSPVVANGFVYATSWNGFLYALDPDDGTVVWSLNTGSAGILGVQSTPLVVTPSGDVCIGDSASHVWCRDGAGGTAIWDKQVGNIAVDHIWSGLATANGRLFVSIASHSDQPCTQGRLVALDLADGADLWTLQTVPDEICDTDTGIACTDDSDCPSGGSCISAVGGGVTATVSFDPTGNFVYMNTVGCYTFPSVGDSDSIFKIAAATGDVIWKTRVDAPEQFGFCSNNSAVDCGTDADCVAPIPTLPAWGAFVLAALLLLTAAAMRGRVVRVAARRGTGAP